MLTIREFSPEISTFNGIAKADFAAIPSPPIYSRLCCLSHSTATKKWNSLDQVFPLQRNFVKVTYEHKCAKFVADMNMAREKYQQPKASTETVIKVERLLEAVTREEFYNLISVGGRPFELACADLWKKDQGQEIFPTADDENQPMRLYLEAISQVSKFKIIKTITQKDFWSDT